MELNDYMEPEVGVAVAVTAAVPSPTVRKALRRSAVYGLAGVLLAGDAVMAATRGIRESISHGFQQANAEAEAVEADGHARRTQPTRDSHQTRSKHDTTEQPRASSVKAMEEEGTKTARRTATSHTAGRSRNRKTEESTDA